MKAKLLFITAYLCLQNLSVSSQCISIELSVTWKMGTDIFYKDSTVSIPLLNITYRNNCDKNYYFLKPSPRKDGVAMGCNALIQYIEPISYLEKAKAKQGCGANQSFNVIIGMESTYDNIWWLKTDADTLELWEDWPAQHVSCCLKSLYEYIDPYVYKKDRIRRSADMPPDMTPDTIMSVDKEQFVFLKPNETHIDTYNLIGYKIVEGCFTFTFHKNTIENYVLYTEYYYDEIFRSKEIELELPSVVGEYQLYSGAFNTNKITICFGER